MAHAGFSAADSARVDTTSRARKSSKVIIPEGAYFYTLTVTKTDGSKEVFEKGALNVLRKH